MPWLILGILADIFFRVNHEFKLGTSGGINLRGLERDDRMLTLSAE